MSDLALELDRTLEEPARVRAFVADQLAGYGSDVRSDALLLVSELVSNVVQHGALPARIVLSLSGNRVHILVEDSAPAMPEGPRRTDHGAPGGRGLIIVAAVAAAWGISTTAGRPGKAVWFDLAVPA